MNNKSTLLLLGLIAVVGVFTLDVYLPGMPAMAKDFGVSISQISYTFTGFSMMFAICQILHGTLSDHVGRKPILLGGLIIAAIATTICVYAKSYTILLVARLMQAIGISVFVVLNAIIRDLYTGVKAIQIRTFVATVSGVTISIAPTIGGLLESKLGWQGGFIASLLLIAITFLFALIFYSESNLNKSKSTFDLRTLARTYRQLFNDATYRRYVVIAALAYTVHFSFIVMSANIFMNILGFSPISFGYLMFVYGAVYFISGMVIAVIAKKLSVEYLIVSGAVCIGMSGISMLALTALTINAWQILVPMTLTIVGITSIRASATTGALAMIPKQAGQGAGALNFVQFMLAAAIATGIEGLGNPRQTLALLAIISSLIIINLINLNLLKSKTHILKEINV